jgi:hypothetical protein
MLETSLKPKKYTGEVSGMPNFASVLTFDGKDDYVSLPEMNFDYSQGFTVEAWVLYHSFNHWSRIIDFGNGQNNNNIVFANKQRTQNLALSVRINTTQESQFYAPGLEAGVWTHVATTIDKSGHTTLYKNGEVLKTGSCHLPGQVNRTLNYIGKSNWTQDGYFHGKMAEVRVWNIARSPADIQSSQYSRLNGAEPGLVGYWPLNEVSGNTVADKTSNGNHGTIHGGAILEPQLCCLKPAIPKTFLIKSKLNGMVLDVEAFKTDPNSRVITYPEKENDKNNQLWTMSPEGVIKSKLNEELVLDFKWSYIADYNSIVVNPVQDKGLPSQQWKIENGVIKNKQNDKLVLDIAASNTESNADILAAPYNGGLNQQWELIADE